MPLPGIIVALVRLLQKSNACDPMFVMLLGIVTLVRPVLKNALAAMLFTDRLLIVLGMLTTPTIFPPVYPVMVIAPLLVTKVNCARTTAGSISSTLKSQIRTAFPVVFMLCLDSISESEVVFC